MRRRRLIFVLAAAWPLVAAAQPKSVPVVGFLNGASADGYARNAAAFREGLKETGFVEGQNVHIEYRWADGRYDRLPALAAELVERRVSVLAATSTPGGLAGKQATSSIPVVFTTSGDPLKLGLVASLNRPGGNVTGVTQLNVEVGSKRVELLHQLLPGATLVALLVNPTGINSDAEIADAQAAAAALGLKLNVLNASTEGQIDAAFDEAVAQHVDALAIGSDPFFNTRSSQLAELALRHRLPAIHQVGDYTRAGGLVGYGGDTARSYHTAGVLTGRILKGEKPGDLPVQRSATVELILNLKTAKALGLTIPLSILGRADEVIE
jgi:putative ABC transport system substrate-binding protein